RPRRAPSRPCDTRRGAVAKAGLIFFAIDGPERDGVVLHRSATRSSLRAGFSICVSVSRTRAPPPWRRYHGKVKVEQGLRLLRDGEEERTGGRRVPQETTFAALGALESQTRPPSPPPPPLL
ncbi:unnamed protein product, partial [Ectocarpus fasciculatus]